MAWSSLGLQLLQDVDNFYNPSSLNNDYFQAEHINIPIMAYRGNFVLSGLEVTEQISPTLTIDISAGSLYVNGSQASLSADTIDLTSLVPAAGGDSKYVLIYIDSAGSLASLAGADETTGNQDYPEMPENSTALAIVALTNGDPAVNDVNIGDMRIFAPNDLYSLGEVRAVGQFVSLLATGTAPLVVASTTLVSNLNADLLDGQEGSYYSPTSHNHSALYQPLDANLTTIAAFTITTDNFIVAGASDWEVKTTAQVKSILDLEIGVDVQAYNAELSNLAGLTKTDGNIIVGNGSTFVAESGATARTSLGLSIGSDVQAFDADLTTIGGLAKTNSNFIVGDGASWVAESGATVRTSLGLGTGDSPTFTSLTLTTSLILSSALISMDASSTITANGKTISDVEVSYLDTVSSNLQTQLNTITSNVSSNDTDIGTNVTNIGSNATNISTNSAAITSLVTKSFNAYQLWGNHIGSSMSVVTLSYKGVRIGGASGSGDNFLIYNIPVNEGFDLKSFTFHWRKSSSDSSIIAVELYKISGTSGEAVIDSFTMTPNDQFSKLFTLTTPVAPIEDESFFVRLSHPSGSPTDKIIMRRITIVYE